MWSSISSIVIGLASGFFVSAGVFALITALSLIPRMADRTHTGAYAKRYEDCVLLGGMVGVILYFLREYDKQFPLFFSSLLLIFTGFFIGIFVGTLAISLAENLNVTAVIGRRVKLHKYFGVIILSFAIGKILGSLVFFYKSWF